MFIAKWFIEIIVTTVLSSLVVKMHRFYRTNSMNFDAKDI